ncbi:MAG: hypothetical protein AAGI92_02910 [Pseudomonadota bacterium]
MNLAALANKSANRIHLFNPKTIARLTAEIKANEERINSIVYGLFGLTDDEIRLLEASL